MALSLLERALGSSDGLVLSGGLATEIERRGVEISNDPLWSARVVATDPELITDIHKCFLMHGADIITTATYQASVEGYQKHLKLCESDAIGLIERSLTIAKKAKDWFLKQPESEGRKVPLIGGSIGPYGASLHDGSEYNGWYMDTVNEQVIKNWHKPRLHTLIEGGVDFLAIETIPSCKEALLVLDLLKEYQHCKVWVAFSCKDTIHTCYGDIFANAIEEINVNPQVLATGINCTQPQLVLPLLQSCRVSSIAKPFVVYANGGQEWKDGKWYGENVDICSSLLHQWKQLGMRIVGGCCKVTPEDIARIRTEFLSSNHES